MDIRKEENGSKVTLYFDGWLDTVTAPQLTAELEALESGITALVFDFQKLKYISSAGLRQIIAAYKKMNGGEFRIINVSADVMEIFRITGFDSRFDIISV